MKKPVIIRERCAAQPEICPPMKQCPVSAFSFIEDENEPLGGRIGLDLAKCNGCGVCADACCGKCIVMEEQ